MVLPSAFAEAQYVDGGQCALRHIAESLTAAGRTFGDIRSCLDLPSGYGRVLRHLVGAIAPSRITACDADRQAVRFCAREFGVEPFFCDRDPRKLRFTESYDLIFVGSLLTHLPEATRGACHPCNHRPTTSTESPCMRHCVSSSERSMRSSMCGVHRGSCEPRAPPAGAALPCDEDPSASCEGADASSALAP